VVKLKMKFAAGIAAAALAVIGGGSAYAAVSIDRVGPPTQNPAFNEFNYAPGAVVYLCVNETTQVVRVETRTDTPDNCAAGEVQLPVAVPTPYPTP
jgi:hypothetical protein